MIEVRNLTKRYGRKIAVDQLSFRVEPGRVTGFLGPNGSGKSTTMRALVGLDRPTSGEALVDGKRYAECKEPLKKVGALLEARAVHPGRSVYGHLLGLARSNRIPDRRVGEVLDIVGLGSAAKERAKGLSLGMGQRLGVAAALLGDPEVLLFDEPLNGLDPGGIQWIRGLMRQLAQEGRTVFVSSHLMGEMALTADHLVVIGQGRLLTDIPTDEFIGRHSRPHILIRTPEPERMRDLIQSEGIVVRDGTDGALEAEGASSETIGEIVAKQRVTVYEISSRTASLEEAFMRLTADVLEYQAKES